MEYGLKISTWQAGGRFQHRVYDIGVRPDRVGEVSNAVVDALKRANETLWEGMPEGSTKLTSEIRYKA